MLYSLKLHVWVSLIVYRRQRHFERDKGLQKMFFVCVQNKAGKMFYKRIVQQKELRSTKKLYPCSGQSILEDSKKQHHFDEFSVMIHRFAACCKHIGYFRSRNMFLLVEDRVIPSAKH